MVCSFIRYDSIIRLAGLTLLAICTIQTPASAYPTWINTTAAQDTHRDLYKNIWVSPGLARGQTLRYTWVNLNDPDPQKRTIEPSRIRVRLLAVDGSLIAQAESATVGTGQFQSFDFNRDQINLPGEELTGRLQTTLEATLIGSPKHRNLVLKQGIVETFDDTIEVIDNVSGRTTVHSKSFQINSAGQDYLIGIVPGQTFRVIGLNSLAPPVAGEDGRRFKVPFEVALRLADGRVIAQSDEISLEPGQVQSFVFKRGELPLSGEPEGRLQVRAQVLWKKLRLKTEFPSSVEIVDDSTGRTTLVLSQKPKEIVVVGSN